VGAEEVPFWEEASGPKGEGAAEAEEEAEADPGYDQAVQLKDEGNEKFARGGAVPEAMDCWVQALDALWLPPEKPEGEAEPPPERPDDPKVLELRVTLLLNLALGHKKLKQWRHVVSYCDEVLIDQPANLKALYRKGDALGELCTWREAEEVAAKLENTGAEGKKLASQQREEWRRRRKAADGQQKKMWSAALSDPSPKAAAQAPGKPAEAPAADVQETTWAMPKVDQMSVFDLRCKPIVWDEGADFDDKVWRDGLGHREASYYQGRALPLTLLAGAALAEIDLQSECIVHCFLDGNMAPFAQPHDWSMVLQRYPSMRSLTVVYIDIGSVQEAGHGPPPMPYGTLLRPTEEGRVGDRVARCARFLGTYREFKEHCRDLPGLVVPHIALWADVPLYGFGDDDFAIRLEAYEMLSKASVPSIVTQGGEVPQRGGPPMTLRVDDQANISIAILDIGLRAKMRVGWHWNRFVVPLERGRHGILAAHAMLGIVGPEAGMAKPAPASIKEALRKKGIALLAYKMPDMIAHEDEFERLRKCQWEAFCKKMRDAGRPVGPAASEEERNRQSMEFYQFCGMKE